MTANQKILQSLQKESLELVSGSSKPADRILIIQKSAFLNSSNEQLQFEI